MAEPSNKKRKGKEAESSLQLPAIEMDKVLDIEDNELVHGKLANGLTYYVRSSPIPASTVIVSLVVKVGSLAEQNDERGVAHMIEHLAFTATGGYRTKVKELLDNMKANLTFGPCDMAFTSFDNTSYKFTIPNEGHLEDAMAIMADISSEVRVTKKVLDLERGVVMSEYQKRVDSMENCAQVAYSTQKYNGSGYEFPIIGTPEVIQSVSAETVTKFYEKWYQMSGMAIFVVGDLKDTSEVVSLIKDYFGPKESKSTLPVISSVRIPSFTEARMLCHVHPCPGFESTSTVSSVWLSYQEGSMDRKSVKAFRKELVENIFLAALHGRLKNIGGSMVMYGSINRDIPTLKTYEFFGSCMDEGIFFVLESVLTEFARIRLYGFEDEEIQNVKDFLLSSCGWAYSTGQKLGSMDLECSYKKHFLAGSPIINLDYALQLQQTLIPQISAAEVSSVSLNLQTTSNCCMMTVEPNSYATVEKLKVMVAEINTLEKKRAICREFKKQEAIYHTTEITPREICGFVDCHKVGATEFYLPNGMRVCCKEVDGSGDWVYLRGFSYGGLSEVDEKDYLSCAMGSDIARMSGICGSQMNVPDKEHINFWTDIGDYLRWFGAEFSAKYTRVAVQLVYLLFTTNREVEAEVLQDVMETIKSNEREKDQNPEEFLDKFVKRINCVKHLSAEDLRNINPRKACQYYNNAFRDPSSFVLVLIGNIDYDTAIEFMSYLGGIPQPSKPIFHFTRGNLKAMPFDFPKSVIRSEVFKPKQGAEYWTRLSFPLKLTNENMDKEKFILNCLLGIITNKVLGRLRFTEGQIYSVHVSLSSGGDNFSVDGFSYCTMMVAFGSAKPKEWDLVRSVLDVITQLQNDGPTEKDAYYVVEAMDKTSKGWCKEIFRSYMSRHYCGDLGGAYEVIEKNCTGSISVEVAKSALRRMLPFPCTKRYTAVILKPEGRFSS